MKWHVILASLLLLARPVLAQGNAIADAIADSPNAVNENQAAASSERVVSLTGRLALEDGSAPPHEE